MTTAPPILVAARRLLLDHLDIHENSRAYPVDLDPDEVGIVGDPAHRGGYHCGSDRVVDDDYSVVESSRDRTGLADWACALDVGWFEVRVNGKVHNLRSMSVWLVAQCWAGAPDTRDIREVIYSPDGTTVRRWDRLGIRSSGDDSHRWHTHISYHRDAIRGGWARDQTAVWRRYLTTIGLLAAPAPAATPAPALTRKVLTMFMLKRRDRDEVYLSDMRERVYVAKEQFDPLRQAGVPLLPVATDADLDRFGGPLRTGGATGSTA